MDNNEPIKKEIYEGKSNAIKRKLAKLRDKEKEKK